MVSRFASFFRGRSGSSAIRRDDDAGARAMMDAYEPPEDRPDSDSPERGLVEVRPITVGALSQPVAPSLARRGKQDLLDDLERSYREVVELVRKVDGHLDKADERAERMASVADRLLEVVERLPASYSEHGERRHNEQIALLQRMVETQHEGVDRLDTTLARLGVQAEVAGQSHEQLVMTMAEFRETMCDVARGATRSAAAVETGAQQQRESDDRLAQIIVGNQRWMIGILAASMTLAAAALVIAVIAVFKMRG